MQDSIGLKMAVMEFSPFPPFQLFDQEGRTLVTIGFISYTITEIKSLSQLQKGVAQIGVLALFIRIHEEKLSSSVAFERLWIHFLCES